VDSQGGRGNVAAVGSPFAVFDQAGAPLAPVTVDLHDVPVLVTVELGRTTLPVRTVLGLGAGALIELQKLAGEPVEVLVNDRLIGRGEVVVVDDNFGVRMTEIKGRARLLDVAAKDSSG
jgi:flagellar motor switch protein FliN/FliY